ncbi:TolB family protein [Streptomyces sanglieri]|uniref:TolB family protein n=1 Tax=Streptomyces sanglieri TaxID=193460 RepID=A0ABW2WQ02_9ACTN
MTTRPLKIEDLYRFEIPGDPALSPDGERVAYTLATQDADNDRVIRSIWEVRAGGGPARRLTHGPADTSPRWSPDGARLAFLRAGRLHLLSADGERPYRSPPPTGARPGRASRSGARTGRASPSPPPRPGARTAHRWSSTPSAGRRTGRA